MNRVSLPGGRGEQRLQHRAAVALAAQRVLEAGEPQLVAAARGGAEQSEADRRVAAHGLVRPVHVARDGDRAHAARCRGPRRRSSRSSAPAAARRRSARDAAESHASSGWKLPSRAPSRISARSRARWPMWAGRSMASGSLLRRDRIKAPRGAKRGDRRRLRCEADGRRRRRAGAAVSAAGPGPPPGADGHGTG